MTPTPKKVAIIVAHPDDETLWVGGTILEYPAWECFIISLCRASDPERAPRFYDTLKALHATGIMADLDDGPAQRPLAEKEVEAVLLNCLPKQHFDLVITHHPAGEYTKHLRHEEVSKAVILLWQSGKIAADELWTFAYEDGHKAYYPRPVQNATIYRILPEPVWLKKYNLITKTYGFTKESWEARTTPTAEAFWRFTDPQAAKEWLDKKQMNGMQKFIL